MGRAHRQHVCDPNVVACFDSGSPQPRGRHGSLLPLFGSSLWAFISRSFRIWQVPRAGHSQGPRPPVFRPDPRSPRSRRGRRRLFFGAVVFARASAFLTRPLCVGFLVWCVFLVRGQARFSDSKRLPGEKGSKSSVSGLRPLASRGPGVPRGRLQASSGGTPSVFTLPHTGFVGSLAFCTRSELKCLTGKWASTFVPLRISR